MILATAALPSSAAAVTVTSNADGGSGSLRAALANASDGDTIDFTLTTPATITLASELVAVQGSALGGGCAAAVAALTPGKTKLPATIKPKKKLTVAFSATFGCAVDPAKTTKKDPGHTDFRWVATVDRAARGDADAHGEDDVCPRPTLPNGVDPRPYPSKPIKDKGCGGKLRTKRWERTSRRTSS